MIRFSFAGISYGSKLRVYGTIGLDVKGSCIIGNHFQCTSGDMSNPMGRNVRSYLRVNKDASLLIGDDVGISSCVIRVAEKISIGNKVKIGALTIITDNDSHSLNPILPADPSTDGVNAKKKPIVIKNNAFIGASCVICKGVTIGENSIVGIGSVVTHSIPDNEIWAGNPAKFIKKIDL